MNRKENLYHDACLYWSVNDICNLHCVYCYSNPGKESYLTKQNVNQSIALSVNKPISVITRKINKLFQIGLPSAIRIICSRRRHPRNHWISKAIDSLALKNALDKTNKIFMINLTGGEPFLIPNIVDVCAEITKKHLLYINTNLVSEKIKEFTERIDPQRVLGINASCHIKELERLNLLDKYIYNFHLCKDKGFSIGATERAYPPLLGEVEKYKEFFKKRGIELAFAQFCGKYNGKLYPESYTDEEIKIFGLEKAPDIKMFHSKGKICNAGYNVGVLFSDGFVRPCYQINESLGNIFDGIKFKKELIKCPHEYCGCPLNCYDKHLFEKALVECGIK